MTSSLERLKVNFIFMLHYFFKFRIIRDICEKILR
ncbi:hypothetical protein T01_6826 [Trichinella spiralis]|uniref:Uncharacterized protein n=1 Tax=Trichinella spiralis TaxID=6334 RepID=A0A0V1AKT5_TRISP|nr:hypothetical protein T01_6826 [Trichinella spiralis]